MYKIGSNIFEIENLEYMEIPENFSLFKVNSSKTSPSIAAQEVLPTHHYSISILDNYQPSGNLIYKKAGFQIYKTEDGKETRIISVPGADVPYGINEEIDETHSKIYINKAYTSACFLDTMFHSLFAWEKQMQKSKMFVLHSSYMVVQGKAFLFTAPSGTGKSTQADLWVRHRGARVINGDRTLLAQTSQGFVAMGWPICGSSEICINEVYPLGGILRLSQAPTDIVEELHGIKAVKLLLSETTINYWNKEFVDSAFDFMAALVGKVPVLHFACTKEESAVKCLEKYFLEKEILHEN